MTYINNKGDVLELFVRDVLGVRAHVNYLQYTESSSEAETCHLTASTSSELPVTTEYYIIKWSWRRAAVCALLVFSHIAFAKCCAPDHTFH